MSTSSYHPQPWEEALEAAALRPKPANRPVSRIQLAVFLAYEGNGDLYVIRNKPDPDMFDGAWGTINSLLQQMGRVESGLASAKYRAEVEAELQRFTVDDATRDMLWVMTRNRKK
jgi:hypothetical protein